MKRRAYFPWKAILALAALIFMVIPLQAAFGAGLSIMNLSSWMAVLGGAFICLGTVFLFAYITVRFFMPPIVRAISDITGLWRAKKNEKPPRRTPSDP